jgi:hypothetical protein
LEASNALQTGIVFGAIVHKMIVDACTVQLHMQAFCVLVHQHHNTTAKQANENQKLNRRFYSSNKTRINMSINKTNKQTI